jgi:hypothetical protein
MNHAIAELTIRREINETNAVLEKDPEQKKLNIAIAASCAKAIRVLEDIERRSAEPEPPHGEVTTLPESSR